MLSKIPISEIRIHKIYDDVNTNRLLCIIILFIIIITFIYYYSDDEDDEEEIRGSYY